MFPITVGAAILNQTPLDWPGNHRRILSALREARAAGVSVLCLPELCLTGYGCEDAFHAPGTAQRAERMLADLLPETAGSVVAFGLPVLHHKALFDAAALAVDGRLVAVVAKRFLAGDGIHYEPRWFKPWREGERAMVHLAGHDVPIGDLLVEVGGVRIGFEICEDAWVAGRPGAALASAGADIILNPSASHFAFGKIDVRRRFVTEGSRAFNVAYVYANLIGNEAGRAIYDGGALIADSGRIVAAGPRLGYHEHHVTAATIDVDAGRFAAARSASFLPRLEEPLGLVTTPFAWPAAAGAPAAASTSDAAWEGSPRRKEEEFTRTLALALFDYLRKSRSQGFVVSLSGGADSTAVATLVAMMARLGVAGLGADGFRARLAHLRVLAPGAGGRLVASLLTTVYQGTANSSDDTRVAARRVAGAIGADHLELDVEPFVRGYTEAVGKALGRAPTWQDDDIALQNIQARARAPGVWMIANLRDALLLATSNRSEAAVGYTTMDGDTCGGLSPIAGIDKAFLRTWLAWMQTDGPLGIGPIPELEVVTSQRSTPELRPLEAAQKSEDDLMPFPVLDAIERMAIRDKLAPVEVFKAMRALHPDQPGERMRGWVVRFFTLWCRNQWKRERFAPSFHLDDENLDPKTWCRFPILSGGFAEELAELRALAPATKA